MQALATIQNTAGLQLTDDDRLRIVSRGTHYLRIPDAHINWLGDNLMNSYPLKVRLWIISQIHNSQSTSQF